jgi:stearoyl-CoA desaturase (delta-9 desaturase)
MVLFVLPATSNALCFRVSGSRGAVCVPASKKPKKMVLNHVTYSINSLCHFFGRRRFDTGDHSHNLLWLAPFSFGEAWHNNHHAFPTSAIHGLGRREIDLSGIMISALERLGLVWDVQRISPDRLAAKALTR